MILPIGDEPNPRGTPWVNYGLLAANVAVFLLVSLPLMTQRPDLQDPAVQAYLRELLSRYPGYEIQTLIERALGQISAYDLFVIEWGYRPAAPSALTLLTSMFLHGGWMHLLGNMLFLWIYGDNVEHRLGSIGYLVAYLLTGAAATLGYAVAAPAAAANTPLVGASGAISGVLGFYFLWFPRNRVRLLIVLFPFFFDVWKVGARWVLGFYLVIDNLLPFLLTAQSGGGGVAHGAHIGGFVAGLVAALGINGWDRLRGRRRGRRRAQDLPDVDDRAAPSAEAVVEAQLAGDHGRAVRRYFTLPAHERQRVPVGVIADLADESTAAGQPDLGLALYQRALHDHPRGPRRDRLLLGAGLILLRHKGRATTAYQYLLDVLDADPEPAIAAQARQALAEIAELQKLPFDRHN